ncbi:MAG: hypothetical protein ACXWCS_24925 [Burkholderiales bacterium]
MEVQQLGPGFFAEIRGVGLADVAHVTQHTLPSEPLSKNTRYCSSVS